MNEQTQTTEQRILEAAEREFLNKGYAGARTSEIAEKAGVTHAMLHYYFRTKEKLFDQILAEKMARFQAIIVEALNDDKTPLLSLIEKTICNHLDFIAQNEDLPRFLINEILYNRERGAKKLQTIESLAPHIIGNIQRRIDECAVQGLCRRVDAAMLILDIASLNLMAFVAKPMVNCVMNGAMDDMAAFVEARKRENVDTIMRKLKI